jgi:hypothetical protein
LHYVKSCASDFQVSTWSPQLVRAEISSMASASFKLVPTNTSKQNKLQP